VEKMRKNCRTRWSGRVREQILLGKTLDFLKANVSVEAAQEPAVKEENHECIERKSFSGADPMVVEQTGRGERSYDIYSRLLKDRIVSSERRWTITLLILSLRSCCFANGGLEEGHQYLY